MKPRPRTLKVHLLFDEGVSARTSPLSKRDFNRAAQLFREFIQDEREWIETCAIMGGAPEAVSILFCTDDQMRAFHQRFRGIDRATDVLSFPQREAVAGSDPLPEGALRELPFGDLVISLETVTRAAKKAKRPVRVELLEVFLHGCLHLAGFDHIGTSPREREAGRRMKSLQRSLLLACRKLAIA